MHFKQVILCEEIKLKLQFLNRFIGEILYEENIGNLSEKARPERGL